MPQLFRKYPNLYGDLSANSAGLAIMRDPDFGLAFLEEFRDRLMFGTDMLNVDMVFPLGAWLDEQEELFDNFHMPDGVLLRDVVNGENWIA